MAGMWLSHLSMCCIAAAVAAATLPAAFAQGYPLKPVGFVSPFPAAGVNDIIALKS